MDCYSEYLQMTSHHKYLLLTSHSSLICALWGGINNNMLWIVPAGVYINSVNYWRNPVGGMRRRIDIGWSVLGLMINNVYAIRYSTNAYPYFIMTLIACAMYPLSYYFYWRKQYIIATFIHSLLHIFANIGNVCLYQSL
jgi:hypothetical protein